MTEEEVREAAEKGTWLVDVTCRLVKITHGCIDVSSGEPYMVVEGPISLKVG